MSDVPTPAAPQGSPHGFAPGALAGRVALVTGAGNGIGRATALVLAGLGASVAALDVDGDAAESTVAAITATGRRGRPLRADLAELSRLEETVETVCREVGPPTILVNNAGIVTGQGLMDTDLATWERILTINLTAPFLLTTAIGRRMVDAATGGSIVNVSSSSAFRAIATSGAYGVSKAGINALTRGAAWELGPHGINVNAVAPGVTRTAITLKGIGDDDALDRAAREGPLQNLLRRVTEPEDIAHVIAFLCLPASRQITGQVLQVSAGAVVAAG